MNGSVIIAGNYEVPRQFGEEIIFKDFFFFKCWNLFFTGNILTDPNPSFYTCLFSHFISWVFWCFL